MESVKKSILIITPFFSPNIGGVETHLDDLVDALNHFKYPSFVLTYSPLTTTGIPWEKHEVRGNCQITRFSWFGKSLFHRLEKFPLFDFLYLTPYLLLRSFIWLCFHSSDVDTIHTHGINAAFIGVVLSKIFNKKHITQTHAIYEHISGLSQKLSVLIFNHCDTILCLSQKSLDQLKSWGVNFTRLHLYRYWINLDNFTPAKSLPEKFTVLYTGRLIDKKGIPELLQTASNLPNINFIFAGNGPSQNQVEDYSKKFTNIKFLGAIKYSNLPPIYRTASVFCIASQYPEGYGRVVMEAVASGLPVVGSNLGSIGEAVDPSVALLFAPTVKNLTANIQKISTNKKLYQTLQQHCRPFALKNFSLKNFQLISQYY